MTKGGESVISLHVVYISRLKEMTEYFIFDIELRIGAVKN